MNSNFLIRLSSILYKRNKRCKQTLNIRRNHSINKLITYNEESKHIIDVFRNLTRCNLNNSIFWYFQNNYEEHYLAISYFKWCNQCFLERFNLNLPLYYKLIWGFKDITHCPIHRTELVDYCYRCNSTRFTFNKKVEIGFCPKCNEPVFDRIYHKHEIRDSWYKTGADLEKLISDSIKLKSYPVNGIQLSINDIYDYYWKNKNENKIYAILDRDIILGICYNSNIKKLSLIREISYKLGISISTLLSGNAINSTEFLLPELIDDQNIVKNHNSLISNNHNFAESMLLLYATDSNIDPIPLKQLTKQIKIPYQYAISNFPHLCEAIIENNKKHSARQSLRAIAHAQIISLETINNPYENRNKTQILKELHEQTNLPIAKLRSSIETAINSTKKSEKKYE